MRIASVALRRANSGGGAAATGDEALKRPAGVAIIRVYDDVAVFAASRTESRSSPSKAAVHGARCSAAPPTAAPAPTAAPVVELAPLLLLLVAEDTSGAMSARARPIRSNIGAVCRDAVESFVAALRSATLRRAAASLLGSTLVAASNPPSPVFSAASILDDLAVLPPPASPGEAERPARGDVSSSAVARASRATLAAQASEICLTRGAFARMSETSCERTSSKSSDPVFGALGIHDAGSGERWS